MGRDKALLELGGATLAARVAAVLGQVAYPVLAVGPEAGTRLFTVQDPREGPLAAFASGMSALAARGHDGPVLLVACDLPLLEASLLRYLVAQLGDADAAVPVVDGYDQPLCAAYGPRAAGIAARVSSSDLRSMREFLDHLRVRRLPQSDWDHIAPARSLMDIDTPDQLAEARRILDEPV
jgi:molybdopterin-guanine dinucleotide biosynthesis protein A